MSPAAGCSSTLTLVYSLIIGALDMALSRYSYFLRRVREQKDKSNAGEKSDLVSCGRLGKEFGGAGSEFQCLRMQLRALENSLLHSL